VAPTIAKTVPPSSSNARSARVTTPTMSPWSTTGTCRIALRDYRDTDLTVRPQAMAVAVVITLLTTVLVIAYLPLAKRLSGRAL
jgi:hypothetical protein